MFRKLIPLLLLLAANAYAVPPGSVMISSLPFTVSAPGTYVLAGNLTAPANTNLAIAIPVNLPGTVTVDLKGFTLTGGGPGTTGIGIGGAFAGPFVSNVYPITVRNGSVANVSFGVWAESNDPTQPLSNLTFQALTVSCVQPPSHNAQALFFGGYVKNSTMQSCTLNNATIGISEVLAGRERLYGHTVAQRRADLLLLRSPGRTERDT
jgi:hypothetical protein